MYGRTMLGAAVAVALILSSALGAHASGGTSTLNITAGALTVTGAAPGDFTVSLTGSDQLAYTTLGSYTPQDDRGTGAGYNVTFQATPFTCTHAGSPSCPVAGDTFITNSLIMAPPTVAAHAGTSGLGRATAPAVSIGANTAIDTGAAAVKVLSAPVDTGMGTYDVTAQNVTAGVNHQLQLAVPSSAYNAFYTSTVTVSIVTGP